jgi:hypothetical protein
MVDLSADLLQGRSAGTVRLSGEFSRLFDADGRFLSRGARMDVTGEVRNLPTVIVERVAGQPGILRDVLGPSIDASFRSNSSGAGRTDVDLVIDAPRLEAKVSLTLAEEMSLAQPAKIRATVTPQLFRRLFPGGQKVDLPGPFEVDLDISHLRMPLPGEGEPYLRADRIGLAASLSVAGAELRTEDLGKVSVKGFHLALRAETLADIRLSGGGTIALPAKGRILSALAEGRPLTLAFEARTGIGPEGKTAPLESEVSLKSTSLEASAAVHLSPAFERLTLTSPLDVTWTASAAAVERLFVRDKQTYKPKGPLTLTLAVTSLEVPLREFALEKVRMTVTGAVPELEIAKGSGTVVVLTEAKGGIEFDGTSNRLAAGFSGGASFPGESGWYPVNADLVLEHFIEGGRTEWGKAALAVDVKSEALPTALAGLFTAGAGRIEALAGKRVALEASVSLEKLTGGRGEARVKIRSPRLDLAASLAFRETVTLMKPADFRLTVTPESFSALAASPPEDPEGRFTLTEDSVLKGRVSSLTWPRSEEGEGPGSGGAFAVTAETGRLTFREAGTEGEISLEGVKLSAETGDLDRGMRVGLEGKVKGPGEGRRSAGSVSFEADLKVPKGAGKGWGEAALTLGFRGVGLPTSLARIFSPRGALLETLAGDRMDIETSLSLSRLKRGSGAARVTVKAPRLDLSADCSVAETVTLKAPAEFRLALTPAAYRALAAAGGGGEERRFTLAEEASLKGRLLSLTWPRNTGGVKKGPPLAGVAVKGSMEADRILFRDGQRGRTVGLEGLSLSVDGKDLAGEVAVGLKGEIIGSGNERGSAGSIRLDAVVAGFYGEDGRLNSGGMSVRADARTGKIPVALVDEWLGLGGMGEAALGETLSATVAVDMEKGKGPLSIHAEATHASLDIDGVVRKGVLGLNSPIVASLDVTDRLGTQLLAKVHPLFETVYTSEKPLRVEIPPAGFVLPLADFDISKAVVPRIRLESNRVTLRKGGLLGALIVLSQQFGGMTGVGARGDTELWFTDLLAEVRGGVFSYSSRLDMLIDQRLHAISWGSVALGGEGGEGGTSRYDLKLGLPADSLRKVLGTKRVSEGEVFVIPLRGTEGGLDVQSISSKAALDLGRVRGQYELSKKDPLVGLIAGQLARQVLGTDPGPIPPPSMTPLPWAALVKPEPAAPQPAPVEKAPPSSPAPSQGESPPPPRPTTPEDAIREALPDEMKGIFDLLKGKP